MLNSIVVYDDGLSLNNSQPAFTQPIAGFYQPAATPNASISYIVGSGQPAKGDRIVLPGTNGIVIESLRRRHPGQSGLGHSYGSAS